MEGLAIMAVVAAGVVFGIAPWPTYRLLSLPSFRREYRCLALRLVLLITLYGVFVVALVAFLPVVALLLSLPALAVILLERWRARPRFGSRSGLPPGSLTLVPRGPWVDDRFFGRQADRYGPVFKMSQFFRPMVCVLGPQQGCQLFREHGDELETPAVRFNDFIPKGFLRFMQADVHRAYRPVFRDAFSATVIRRSRSCLQEITEAGLSAMAARSRTADGQGMHPAGFVEEIVFKLVVRMFIGVEADSSEQRKLRQLYAKLAIGKASCRAPTGEAAARNEIADIVLSRAEAAEGSLEPCFLKEIVLKNGKAAVDRTVVLNLVYMMKVATSDFSGLLVWSLKLLSDNPRWLRELQEADAASSAKAERLATNILRETLRLERSEFIFRRAKTTFSFNGYTIPRGWIVRVCIRDGHRDERIFTDADVFNPMRFSERSFARDEYSPLGIGTHACLGTPIIFTAGSVFLATLARGFELRKVSDGPRRYGRSHWEPGPQWRIRLESRAAIAVPSESGQSP